MEIALCVNAHQDSQVKNAIPEIHAHQIHVKMEFVWLLEHNSNVCVLHHSKDQHVLIKIHANQIHAKTEVNAHKWDQDLCVLADQVLLDQNVTSAIHAHQIHV